MKQSCEFCIPDVLCLIRAYLNILNENSIRYHFAKDMVFTFYFKENVQLKLRMVSLDGKYYFILMFENIAERSKLERANDKLNYSFMLINSLSHELFNPLHQILLYSDGVVDSLNKDKLEKQVIKEDMTVIKQISSGLFQTVKNLLDYAKIIDQSFKLDKSRFMVKEVFEYMISIFSMMAKKKGIVFKYECDKNLEVYSDLNRLSGLIFIFVENSIKFTKMGGLLLSAHLVDHRVVFKVIDSGEGIRENDLFIIEQMIENPYAEVSTGSSAGLGIGMRIAQHLYKKLTTGDQIIEIKSIEEVGTTIQFEIVQGLDRNFSRHSPSMSYRSGTSIVMVNNVEVEAEKQAEFRNERDTLFVGLAKMLKSQLNKLNTPLSKHDTRQIYQRELSRGGVTPQRQSILNLENTKIRVNGGVKTDSFGANMGIVPESQLSVLSKKQQDSLDPYSPERLNPHIFRRRSQQPQELTTFKGRRKSIRCSNLETNENSELELPPESSIMVEVHPMPDSAHEKKPVGLVVDDDAFNCDLAKSFLISMGLEVYVEYRGETAIALCETFLAKNKKIDIVFMDYNMPGIYGDETTRVLRQPKFDPILKGVPIIGLTAHCDSNTRSSCLSSGMTLVENKPFQYSKLKAILKKLNIIEEEKPEASKEERSE